MNPVKIWVEEVRSMRRLLDFIMGIGIVLLPFTTTPFGERGIVSYGVIVLSVWCILAATYLLMSTPTITKKNQSLIVVSFWLVALEGASLLYVPDYLASGLRMAPVIIGYILFLYILVASNTTIMVTERYLKILFLGGFALAVVFLVHFVLAVQQYSLYEVFMDRVVGGKMALQWGASNLIAANLLLFPLLGLYLGVRSMRSTAKAYYYGVAGLQMFAMVLTLSRNAMLSMAIATSILLMLRIVRFRELLKWSLSSLILAAIALTVFRLESSVLWERILFRFTSGDFLTFNGRLQIWMNTWQLYLTSPLLGVGYYGSLAKMGHSAHNIWLLTLTENGPLALLLRIAFYWLLARRVYLAFKHDKAQDTTSLPGILFAILVASLVDMTFEDVLLNTQYIIYSWMFYGICWGVALRSPAFTVTNRPGIRPLRSEIASGGTRCRRLVKCIWRP